MLLKIQEVRDVGTAPAVNALIVVTDDAQVSVFPGEGVHQIELSGIGVLGSSTITYRAFGATGLQNLGKLTKEPQGK
jgi:hypothetical protein